MTVMIRGKLKGGALVESRRLQGARRAVHRPTTSARFVFERKATCSSIGERGQARRRRICRGQRQGSPHQRGRLDAEGQSVRRASAALATIWTYGNRNPQGLAMRPTNDLLGGRAWPPRRRRAQPSAAGKNYGWPVISYGMNYNGTPWTEATAKDGMKQPMTYWVPSIAVASIDFYPGTPFPKWKGDLLVGSLARQELRRLELTGNTVTKQEVLFKDVGRLRDVVVGPDGFVYIAFNQPDRIARLVPAPAAQEPPAGRPLTRSAAICRHAFARRPDDGSGLRPRHSSRGARRAAAPHAGGTAEAASCESRCARVSSSIARWRGLQAVCSVATVRARARRRPSPAPAPAPCRPRSSPEADEPRARARPRPAAPRPTCSPTRAPCGQSMGRG